MVRWAVISACCIATVAQAGVFGFASAQGQAQTFEATGANGATTGTRSLLISENLGLHYAGTPFGPNALLLGAGFEGMNVNAFGDTGSLMSGRAATVDLSVGLFPRRALPLRLYVRGTLTDGSPQSFATLGGRESLAYGANVHLEPYKLLPGLRLDAEQHHFTGFGTATPLGDVRRTLTATLYKSFDAHQVTATARVTQEARTAVGEWLGANLLLSWTSPKHTTTVLAESVDRSRLVLLLPNAPRSMVERTVRLGHQQRWTARFFTDATARLSDVRLDSATGTQGAAAVGAAWQPLEQHELQLSATGDVGFATTSATTQTGSTAGGSARAGYGRPLGPVRPGVSVGAMAQHCANCVGLKDGWLGAFETGASVSTLGFERFDAQLDYRLALVRAPMGRGGNRTEHHARANGRIRLPMRGELNLLVAWDDGYRDYIDLSSGGIATLREQAFTVGAGVHTTIGRGTAGVDARHARGLAVLPAATFSFGPPLTAREVTQVTATALVPVSPIFDAQAGALGAWTVLDGGRPLTTYGGNVGLTARVGRFTSQLTWNVMRNDTAGFVTTQHLVRLSLSRPFDF